MSILIIDNHTDEPEHLLHFCKKFGLTYDIVDSKSAPQDNREYELTILSGGMWYDDPTQLHEHYEQEISLIQSSHKPIIGICLGMQLIALAFDGEVMKLKREHHQKELIALTPQGKDFFHNKESLLGHENHTMGVTTVPTHFTLLTNSSDSAEIIVHNHLPIIGIQSHPEKLHKKEDAAMIWRSLFNILGLELG